MVYDWKFVLLFVGDDIKLSISTYHSKNEAGKVCVTIDEASRWILIGC
jgi:hypothetical protein